MAIPAGFDPKLAHVVSQWPHDRPLNACRFDPVGRFVFSGSEDAAVERFNLADGVRSVIRHGSVRSRVHWMEFMPSAVDVMEKSHGGNQQRQSLNRFAALMLTKAGSDHSTLARMGRCWSAEATIMSCGYGTSTTEV